MHILKNLCEILSGLKRGKLTPKLCPKCGSTELRVSSGFDTYPRMFGITPLKYICESCGYRGPIVMEIEETETR